MTQSCTIGIQCTRKNDIDKDSAIRFVTIFDTKDEKILCLEHNHGTTNLLSEEESQESF